MKKILYVLLFIALGIYLPDFCHKQTKGFSVSKITKAFPLKTEQKSSLRLENQEEISLALDQPFYYLRKGRSAYVFISLDQQYILKFLRNPNISPPFWAELKPMRWLLPSYCNNLIKKKETNRNLLLASYNLADKNLKKQTGILYSHLNTTSLLKKKITFYDNIKVKHLASADSTAFVLQKKASPFCPYFKNLLNEKKTEEIEHLLIKFALLLQERAINGISDKDLSPHYNLGILNDQFLTFDLDGLRTAPVPANSESMQKHMVKDGMKMILWLEAIHSDLSIFLEQEIYKLSLFS